MPGAHSTVLDESCFHKFQEIQHVLNNSGTASRLNEAAIIPFREQLTFHKLPESLVVSIGGRVIRDSTEAISEKNHLLSTIRRFVFN